MQHKNPFYVTGLLSEMLSGEWQKVVIERRSPQRYAAEQNCFMTPTESIEAGVEA